MTRQRLHLVALVVAAIGTAWMGSQIGPTATSNVVWFAALYLTVWFVGSLVDPIDEDAK